MQLETPSKLSRTIIEHYLDLSLDESIDWPQSLKKLTVFSKKKYTASKDMLDISIISRRGCMRPSHSVATYMFSF